MLTLSTPWRQAYHTPRRPDSECFSGAAARHPARWYGDTNFMTALMEARLLPEDLRQRRERLRALFAQEEELIGGNR